MTEKLNRFSSRITEPRSQGASQAMLYGTGLKREDMSKAEVGISSVWWEGNTCNMHLNDLATQVKKGVVDAGLVGMRFNTIGVSDGISMGTPGMRHSLPSRKPLSAAPMKLLWKIPMRISIGMRSSSILMTWQSLKIQTVLQKG